MRRSRIENIKKKNLFHEWNNFRIQKKTLNDLWLDTELSWGYGRYFTYETGFSETFNDFLRIRKLFYSLGRIFWYFHSCSSAPVKLSKKKNPVRDSEILSVSNNKTLNFLFYFPLCFFSPASCLLLKPFKTIMKFTKNVNLLTLFKGRTVFTRPWTFGRM